jgi:UDP-3-O-[3-hydroxymyristoyl] N-acetylglucosamine deacetylase
MKSSRQTTLQSHATVTGVGVHSGTSASLTLGPAPADAGFIFVRTGADGVEREITATAKSVVATDLATVLGDKSGPVISTAEHVLSALRGMGVDNATIEVDGPEVPIMDGSAADFVAAIEQAGIESLNKRRRYIEVLKPVQVVIGESIGEMRPNAAGFRAECEIQFSNRMIGHQRYALDLTPETYRRDVSRARTFGCMSDVTRLWAAGFARGASMDNAIVFDDDRILNPEGLRFTEECARHKVLDAIGDLALAGLPLLATYRSMRGGHKLNHAVLTALLADRSAWRVVDGEGARRSSGHAEAVTGLVGGLVAPAFAPDVS